MVLRLDVNDRKVMRTVGLREALLLGIAFILLHLCVFNSPVMAEEGITKEHLIKTAFVYNFLKFVSWGSPVKSLTTCVEGKGSMAKALKSLEGKSVGDISIEVRWCKGVCRLERCRVIFVTSSWAGDLRKLLSRCESKGILTISDKDRFVDEGGIIGLKKEGGRIRFEINLKAAKDAHVFISSKLLKLARRVVR